MYCLKLEPEAIAALVSGELRSRSEDNDFYNDFRLMIARISTPNLRLSAGVTIDTDEKGLTWLSQQKPLWPVLEL